MIQVSTAVVLGCLGALAAPGAVRAQAPPTGTPVADSAIPVRSIDAADGDDSDLEPLIDIIGGSRVVVLGEATHSDGATSMAKARLVRFLHERMGFDVLMWEAGVIDCRAMDLALRGEGPLEKATSQMMYGGWDKSLYVQPVFELARASWKTGRPLEMAGFDQERRPYGVQHIEALLDQLYELVPDARPSDEDRSTLQAMLKRTVMSYFSPEGAELPSGQREHEAAVLRGVVERAHDERRTLVAHLGPARTDWMLWALSLVPLQEQSNLYASLLAQQGGTDAALGQQWNAHRDRCMADNLLWQLEHGYPGRKLIVWAATAHFIRNSAGIRSDDPAVRYGLYDQAGDLLAPVLAGDLYTIAFTSYAGERGMEPRGDEKREETVGAVEPAPSGSIEAELHAAGRSYAFVDLRSQPSDSGARDERLSVCLGSLPNRARWAEVIDAWFFIDQQQPERMRDLGK